MSEPSPPAASPSGQPLSPITAGSILLAVAGTKLLVLLIVFIGLFVNLDDFDSPVLPIALALTVVPAVAFLAFLQFRAGLGLLKSERRRLAIRATAALLGADLIPAISVLVSGGGDVSGYVFTGVFGLADAVALYLVTRTLASEVRA